MCFWGPRNQAVWGKPAKLQHSAHNTRFYFVTLNYLIGSDPYVYKASAMVRPNKGLGSPTMSYCKQICSFLMHILATFILWLADFPTAVSPVRCCRRCDALDGEFHNIFIQNSGKLNFFPRTMKTQKTKKNQ